MSKYQRDRHKELRAARRPTGRSSDFQPRMLNVPIKSELVEKLKIAFEVEDLHAKVAKNDFASVESRVFSAIAADTSVDRDYTRYTPECLEVMAKKLVGQNIYFHDEESEKLFGKVFDLLTGMGKINAKNQEER